MAILGLCNDSNIRKYYCKNYFLTFKCYCFHWNLCVAAPLFIRLLDKYDTQKKTSLAGFFFLLFLASKPRAVLRWPNSLQRLGQTINASIIERLTKKVGCGGIKNFMARHYAPL